MRTPDVSRLDQEFGALKDIFNRAWDRNWGFVPFSDDELNEMVKDLGQYFDPRLTFFAHVDGKVVAFMLALPDMNRALHRAYPRPGKPEPITLLDTTPRDEAESAAELARRQVRIADRPAG